VNLSLGRVGRIGRSEEQAEHVLDDRDAPALREQRVYQARKTNWTELEETVLVERGPWLVDADSDRVYQLHRGATFVGGRLEFDRERTDVAFYVDRNGDVVVLEAVHSPATWSEVVERQTRSEHRAEAVAR
jgi:hypothetical protein